MKPHPFTDTMTGAPARAPARPALVNYRVNRVTFSLVREPEAPARQLCSDPAAVARIARAFMPDDAREHFSVLMLDARNALVAVHEVSTGTLSASLVHPREVFGPALRLLGVAALILVHNHPSGDPTPSREDIRLTRQLVEAGRILDIRVHDHIVIGDGTGQFTSFAEKGIL